MMSLKSKQQMMIFAGVAGAVVGLLHVYGIFLIGQARYAWGGDGLLGLFILVPPSTALFGFAGMVLVRVPVKERVITAMGVLLGAVLGSILLIRGFNEAGWHFVLLGYLELTVMGLLAYWLSRLLANRPVTQQTAVFLGVSLFFALPHLFIPQIEDRAALLMLRIRVVWMRDVAPTELVWIPAGPFLMGHDLDEERAEASEGYRKAVIDETPLHEVHLDGYSIEVTEVSIGQYANCVADGMCALPPRWREALIYRFFSVNLNPDLPATYVTWKDAYDYCASIGRRLPTEAEWEKAARGTDGRLFPWGNGGVDCAISNFAHGCERGMVPVGSYPAGASPYGVLDMIGNAGEWVHDWYAPDYYECSPTENPTGPSSGQVRVVRGENTHGGWLNADPDAWHRYSVHTRFGSPPQRDSDNRGFRCAVTP